MPTRNPTSVRAGNLRRRITIQNPTGVTDADLEADTDAGVTYTQVMSGAPDGAFWASVEPLTNTSGQTQGESMYLVQVRGAVGLNITNGMHVMEAATGIDLEIMGVNDINEAHRVVHLQAISRRYPPV